MTYIGFSRERFYDTRLHSPRESGFSVVFTPVTYVQVHSADCI